MRNSSKTFQKNHIFINCPFDIEYKKIFYAIVFTLTDLGYTARCALETDNGSEVRLDTICEIIKDCKYAIHDLSRTELDKTNKLPRMNMPFELGLFIGCKRFGEKHQKKKSCLILDSEKYRFQKYISDIAGKDLKCHSNNSEEVIKCIRNWLQTEENKEFQGPHKIINSFNSFMESLPTLCKNLGFKSDEELTFSDLIKLISKFILRSNKKPPGSLRA